MSDEQEAPRPPFPPFTRETAITKVRLAEDAWNTRNPERVSKAYTLDSRWRNRNLFIRGRESIVTFLAQKWAHELDYRLIKELWAFTDNRIAVRFAYGGTTATAIGSARTEMKTGNSTRPAS